MGEWKIKTLNHSMLGGTGQQLQYFQKESGFSQAYWTECRVGLLYLAALDPMSSCSWFPVNCALGGFISYGEMQPKFIKPFWARDS